MKSKSFLVVISGPSGVGKKTIIKELTKMNPDFIVSISATSRNPRIGEIEGVDYYFLSEKEFIARIENHEFLEWAMVHGNYYGTLIQNFLKAKERNMNLLMEIDVQGGKTIKKKFPQDSILIFLLPPTFDELEKRIKGRGSENQDQINIRLKTAKLELLVANEYDYTVINDEPNLCAKEIMYILKGSRLDEKERTKRNH